MTPIAIVLLMTVYFGILFLISHFVSKNNTGNEKMNRKEAYSTITPIKN